MNKTELDFIPAQESGWFILLFDLYVSLLFRRRFHRVWVDQNYYPTSESITIYYLNHTSWWDGLIPFLLNQKIFKQKARAMMDERQMKKYSLFRRIGAFSVDLQNPKSVIKSLRYAVKSLDRTNASLYIYPEGLIVPFSADELHFKKGLAWIAVNYPGADVVPIGIYMHTAKSDKPELFIKIGKAVEFDQNQNKAALNTLFESELTKLLNHIIKEAHSDEHSYRRI